MANTVGQLVAKLALDAVEFTTGLTKSEYEAKKFAERIEKGFATAGRAAGIAIGAIAAAAGAAAIAVDQLVKQAGNFQDLAEKTGASAESLASFAVAAGVAGTDMETVAAASVKLTKGLVEVDDESKAAGAALTALGIPIKEFKQLDPAAQLEAVAKAMEGFKDNANKTAVAVALFGKAGADLLPFLKELAGESGRQNILTAEQIRLADEYADSQARTTAQIRLYAQALATQTLPAINAFLTTLKEVITGIDGVGDAANKLRANNAVADFAEGAALALATVIDQGDAFYRVFQLAGNVIGSAAAQLAALARGDLKSYSAIQEDASRRLDDIINKESFRSRLIRNIADQRRNDAQRSIEDRGFDPRGSVGFTGKQDDGKKAKALKDQTTDAERYIKTLERQLQGTLDLNVVQEAEIEIMKLWKDVASGMTEGREQLIRATAAQILANQQAKKAEQERIKAEEEARRQAERNAQELAKNVEAMGRETDAIYEHVRALKEQAAFLYGGEKALKALKVAQEDSRIAALERVLAMQKEAGSYKEIIDGTQAQIDALKALKQAGEDLDLAEVFAAEAKAAQDFANLLTDSFASAFEGFIQGTKSAKDAFRDFASDVQRYLTKLALQKVGDAIFGGNTAGGPDFFSMLAKFAVGAMGSGGGGVPGVGFSGGGFGEHFANGGISRGGMAMVGERGPELVNLPRGAQVIPNEVLRQRRGERSINNVFHVNVMPGATTQSSRQAGKMVAGAVMQALRNP